MVFLEALVGKEDQLRSALVELATHSRQESTCLSYHLHQDPENPCQFALYEQWESKELHALQFEKPYVLKFSGEAEGLLAKPFSAFFGKELDFS